MFLNKHPCGHVKMDLQGQFLELELLSQTKEMCTLLDLLCQCTQPSRVMERYFPDGPVVKTLPSNVGSVGSMPGWGVKIPHALPKTQKT